MGQGNNDVLLQNPVHSKSTTLMARAISQNGSESFLFLLVQAFQSKLETYKCFHFWRFLFWEMALGLKVVDLTECVKETNSSSLSAPAFMLVKCSLENHEIRTHCIVSFFLPLSLPPYLPFKSIYLFKNIFLSLSLFHSLCLHSFPYCLSFFSYLLSHSRCILAFSTSLSFCICLCIFPVPKPTSTIVPLHLPSNLFLSFFVTCVAKVSALSPIKV